MNKMFNYETGDLFAGNSQGIYFKLKLRPGHINIINGDSGSGKSLLCQFIRDKQTNETKELLKNKLNYF